MNKSNAHLYLPLVQALADGKDVQMRDGPNWKDMGATGSGFDFGFEPSWYRIKPPSFPPIPDGMSYHNPDGLTAEQVGDGWRLTVKGEKPSNPDMSQLWQEGNRCFIERDKFWLGDPYQDFNTYRVASHIPFPDGSYLKDGQLARPWVPKFKVGDRVKMRTDDRVAEVIEILGNGFNAYSLSTGTDIEEEYLEFAPLPEPPKLVPLGPSDWLKDGPWWIRSNDMDTQPFMVVSVTEVAIGYGQDNWATHEDATSYERTNNGTTWTPCHKPA